MVSNQNVVRVPDEEAGWGHVRIVKRVRRLNINDKILCNLVLSFHTILAENTVTLDIIEHILRNAQVLNTVQRRASIVRFADEVVGND